jgi:hypothetical protein
MTRLGTRIGFGLALGLGLLAVPQAGADDPKAAGELKPATSSPAVMPRVDWSGYLRVTEITAEVVRADENSLTLRISWLAPKGNQRMSRPQLHHSHGMTYSTPGRQRSPQMTVHHHDYTIAYAPEGGVRTRNLPPKLDADGKKVAYTQEERDALRAPSNAPGYAAPKTDLVAGSIVDVIIIRDKKVAAEKVTEADLRVKYATIIGQDPNPPKDIGGNKNKKKN